jgi:membrane protease YdiL (CAAX protease family)
MLSVGLKTMNWGWPTVWRDERGGWWRLPATLALVIASSHWGTKLSFALVPASSRGAFNANNPATLKQVVQMLACFLPQLIILATLLAGIRFVHRKPPGCVFTDGRPFQFRLALQSAAVWVVLWLVPMLVLPQAREQLAHRAGQVSLAWWPILALSAFAASLLVATEEEAFFRGYLQPRLGAWVKYPWLAVGLPATLFTLTHRGSSWAAYADLALASLLWGTAALRAGTLAPLIGMHATNNTLNALSYPDDSNADVGWVGALLWAVEQGIWFSWLLWATRRRPVEAGAPPEGPAHPSQPVGSETNQTSAAAP